MVIKVPFRCGRNCQSFLPEEDRPILEAAIHCKATHLLTGDIKDFGPFMNHPGLTGGVLILIVSEFLDGFVKAKSGRGISRKNEL